ncbi:hypothetical protein [Paraburkholderia tropica]|uniref:hypothetical protein n=1 Tax=Paraburkholderia tropica TaxID=92647 RepID=UPI002AB71929|nr:hypothetical protein [Paraburkholderia tropica]
MSSSKCPLEEGDRIDHKIFGFGTVVGAPVSMVEPDTQSANGVRDAGWSVPVKWDDPTRTAGAVMHQALRKVSSPDSRPFSHWDRQWQPLLQAWLAARRDVEELSSSFRPVPELHTLTRMQEVERKAFEAMQRFWSAEQSGEHP